MQGNQDSYLPLLPKAGDDGEDSEFPNGLAGGSPPPPQYLSAVSLITLVVSLFSVLATVWLHLGSTSLSLDISSPRFVASLRKVTPYPNLDEDIIDQAMELKSAPKMWFPSYIARANAAEPDRTYSSSSTVTLSPSDSMFYRFGIMKNAPNSTCYVVAAVPNASKLLAGNKSYVSEGDVSAIEIWKVSYNASQTELSWNTRPRRESLLGTVSFTPLPEVYDPEDERDGMELRPPTPLFECDGDSRIAIEVTCSDCRLNFEQVFSDPPLAFDVWVLK